MLDFNVDENDKPVDNDDEIVKEGRERMSLTCIFNASKYSVNI
jgi:hypothetical protein